MGSGVGERVKKRDKAGSLLNQDHLCTHVPLNTHHHSYSFLALVLW